MDSNKHYNRAVKLKEDFFYELFLHGNFDLKLMKFLNIIYAAMLEKIKNNTNVYKIQK